MANLLSAGTAFAGLYGPISLAAGTPLNPIVSGVVTVYQSDGSTSALDQMWTDETKTVQASSNQITTDSFGTVTFYADPGIYVLSFLVSGTPTTKIVTVDPWFTDAAWNVVVDEGNATALSGDSHLVHADSEAVTITSPDPVIGARVKVAKIDQTANVITVEPPSGDIYGPGCAGGVTSIPLGSPGAYVELMADGTSSLITGGALDTGWQNITEAASGWTNGGKWRQIGNRVEIYGSLATSSGFNNTNPFLVPASGGPPVPANEGTGPFYFIDTNALPVELFVSGGHWQCNFLNGGTSYLSYFSGVTYLVD